MLCIKRQFLILPAKIIAKKEQHSCCSTAIPVPACRNTLSEKTHPG